MASINNLNIETFKKLFENKIQPMFKAIEDSKEEMINENTGKNIGKKTQKNSKIKEIFITKLKELLGNNLRENFVEKPDIKNGYEIRPNNNNTKEYHKSGWLYDFTLTELYDIHNKGANQLKRLVLAMEVELTEKEGSIINDFNKLLQAEAEYKIMVFQRQLKQNWVKVKEWIDNVLQELENAVSGEHSYEFKSDAKYLICGWCSSKDKKEFIFCTFEVENLKASKFEIENFTKL